jgi:hypothetical protein
MSRETLKKIKLILELIQKKKRFEPKKQTFKFGWEEFTKFPLLNDRIMLGQLFKRVEKESKCIVFLFSEIPPGKIFAVGNPYSCTEYQKQRMGNHVIWVSEEEMEELRRFTVYIEDFEEFNNYYEEIRKKLREEKELPKEKVKLKQITNVGLIKSSFSLIINGGEYILCFRSKRHKEEKETKTFKVLYHLWDYRKEIKKGKMKQSGYPFVTLSNLAIGAGCTKGAAYLHIKRLRRRFEENGFPIKITASGTELYQLVITLS